MRHPIGYVEFVVRMPLYEGDKTEGDFTFPLFYEDPGVNQYGELSVCRRECKTIEQEMVITTK